MTFQLSKEQGAKLTEWLKEQHVQMARRQWQIPEIKAHMVDENTPYLGAIGGGLTYEFTPTSLGTVTNVYFCRGTVFETKIDLTDYDAW